MTFEYIKEKCDATEAMIKDGLSQEFVDHEHFYFQAKNDIFELKEELKRYFKEQEEILMNTPLTRNEYKKKLETLQKIYKKDIRLSLLSRARIQKRSHRQLF